MLFNEPFGGVIPGPQGTVLAVLLRTDAPLTGRQIHAMVSDRHSLWSVQEALKALFQLGLTHTQSIGRATVHTINEDHYFTAPLRALLDPMASLTDTVRHSVGDSVEAVILFGSLARGEAHSGSDVDLAVIAPSGWDGRTELEDAVLSRIGNDCEILVFSRSEFTRLAAAREPVVDKILTDGVPLVGSIPRVDRTKAA
ncbi:nucleotidyltransferase domain-containing protein [Phytoactinopolyspora limicola]|uniref:nucleotidyltransferase domain-containing protein n=1 Tax=Phytoactinopolyspora limicola TaxID=2715536 RepID=UPI0014086320|nr:nucleotidyltransferase domain-containing protein [Phytoactinopolyspora limicola]